MSETVPVERRSFVFFVGRRGRERRGRLAEYGYWPSGLRPSRRFGRWDGAPLVEAWIHRRLRRTGWIAVSDPEIFTSREEPRAFQEDGITMKLVVRMIPFVFAIPLGVDGEKKKLRIPAGIRSLEIDERLEGLGIVEWTWRAKREDPSVLQLRRLRKPGDERPRTYAVSGEIPGATGKLFGKERLR